MDRLFIVSIVIFVILFLVTYLLSHFFSSIRFIKYTPSLICLIFAITNIILTKTAPGEGFKDLGRIVMAMFLFVGFLSGILSAMYFDYFSPKFKRRK
jgi:uncharacterized membrane protein YozB (DUF420 family)